MISFLETPPTYSIEQSISVIPKEFKKAKEYTEGYTKVHEEHRIDHPQFPLENEEWVTTSFPETFVLSLKNGRIFGHCGAILDRDNHIIEESITKWGQPAEKNKIFQREAMPPLQKVKGRIAILASNAANCYYHWLFEILPRLEMLKIAGVEFDKIYIPKMQYPFQRDSLLHLGIHNDLLIEGDKETFIEADEIIFPSLPNKWCCTHPLWVCDFLRLSFGEPSPPDISQRIYISRKTTTNATSSRKIVNEEEAFSYLESKGFTRVVLEEISILEQARLFSSAEIVVAAHGAGLSNLVYCQPKKAGVKVRVIEIFRPEHLDPTYFFLSHQLGFEHHCLLAPSDRLTLADKENGNLYFSTEDIQKILELE